MYYTDCITINFFFLCTSIIYCCTNYAKYIIATSLSWKIYQYNVSSLKITGANHDNVGCSIVSFNYSLCFITQQTCFNT